MGSEVEYTTCYRLKLVVAPHKSFAPNGTNDVRSEEAAPLISDKGLEYKSKQQTKLMLVGPRVT